MVKKLLQVAGFSFLLIFGVGGYLTSCANVNGPNSDNPDSNINKGKDLSINMNNLTGLAIGDGASVAKSAARSATSEGMLLKILDDGSVENFFNLPEGASLAPVSFITQSTSENAKEIYVVFQYESYWWDNGDHRIGQLLCIYEDGSYVDIMQTNDGTWRTLANRGNQDSPIRFDGNGNMYYLVEESTNNNWLHMIYKFNPKTGVSEQLVGQIPNTYYDEFYVSKDGLWLFAKANRWQENNSSVSYLRAIPTTDVNNPVNLFYDSTGSSWLNNWIYDENSKNVYYTQGDAFYKIPYKDGTYDKENKELLYGNDYNNSNNNYNVGYIWWDTLLKGNYVDGVNNSTYTIKGRSENQKPNIEGDDYRYYYFISKETEEIDYKEIVDYYFALLLNYVKDNSNIWDEETSSWIYKNYRNEYEICFDEFENVEGFEKLATETKDADGNSLVDEELFKAIVEKDLLGLLYELIYSERYTTKTTWDTYKNNFFADVLYQKESKEKINTELFDKDETGFRNYLEWEFASFIKVDNEWQEGGFFYTWKDEFLDETTGKVVAQKVLDKLAACCGKDAIDFSLAYFENLEGYEGLYTDAKNEEAIAFLDSKEKLRLLSDFFCDPNITEPSSLFLSNTCFVPGTDTPAWNYYSSNNDNSFWISSINKLILCGTSLYGLSYENKVVHLIDGQGEPIMRCVNIDYTDPIKIASANVYGNGFYIQNAVVNAAGEEEGAHVILRYDFVSEQIENLFYNMPNNKSYEVISYTVGGDNLYCCLSKGIEISTWKINITTKEITKIESSSKLTQIIVVK